ncbi:MAG: protein kinase, partial [Okeania sp. SIO2D1]|nr:protein kinase [Okeania sp. SIO2D1]
MHKILNYELVEKIYVSDRTVIHRAWGKLYQKPVILKLPHYPYPNFNELTRYRNAYTLIKNLNFPGIVKMLALEKFEQRLILVMEDFGGISLHQFINNQNTSNFNSFSTDINQFFHIALQIINSLEKLHQHQIIHKDIKPQNII